MLRTWAGFMSAAREGSNNVFGESLLPWAEGSSSRLSTVDSCPGPGLGLAWLGVSMEVTQAGDPAAASQPRLAASRVQGESALSSVISVGRWPMENSS